MSDIMVETTATDAASKSLKVTVPVERVQAAESKALKYYAQRARLPGFRQGKAPEAVVKRRFGEAIRQSVVEELIRESWDQAKASESLKPISDPSIRNLKFEDGSPMEFELLVEVRPELKLERTGGFKLRREVTSVTDEAVAEQIERVREQKATWIPIEGAKPAPGQMVRVEVAPLDDAGTVGPSQPYDLVLGENRALPQLEERIMELTPGQTVDTDVRFPDDHPDESKRGQSRHVRLTLYDVKRQELPDLDDAFAREVGEFDTLDALRTAVREDLSNEAKRDADARVRDQLVQQLAEANNITAPESLVHKLMHGYANAYQIPEEQLGAFEQQFHPVAEAQVKRDLMLDALVNANDLRATESDVDARIAEMARSRGVETGQLYAQLEKAKRLPELERAITEEKAFDFLLKQSTVDEATS